MYPRIHDLIISIVCFTIGLFLLTLLGCASQVKKEHKVKLKNVVVHFCQKDHPMMKGCDGKACSANHIWIRGYEQNGKIFPEDLDILGHEFQHLLNWKDKRIKNPDEL